MPKSQPFIHYVKKRITELKSEGIIIDGMEEGVNTFGTEWKEMSSAERAPFVREAENCNTLKRESTRAKTEGTKLNTMASHFKTVKTFLGNPFFITPTPIKVTGSDNYPRMVKPRTTSAIVGTTNAAKIDQMVKLPISIDTRSDEDYINDLLKNQKPANLFFILINCNYHCRDNYNRNGLFIPSEIGLTCFSFRKGIVDSYWSLVDPGSLPYGRRLDAMENKKTFKIPLPPFEQRFQDFQRIVNNVRLFMKRYKMAQDDYTNVYCIPSQTKFVEGCLAWLGLTVGSQNFKFEYKIRSLTTLVQKLDKVASDYDPRRRLENLFLEAIRSPVMNMAKPVEELTFDGAMDLISGKTDLAFHEEFGCPYHRSAAPSGIQFCCLNIVNRYSMHIMTSLSKKFGIISKIGCHTPCKNPEDDVEKINRFLTNWGYLPQSLVYEELENERCANEDEDENWFIIERQEFEQNHPEVYFPKNFDVIDIILEDQGQDAAVRNEDSDSIVPKSYSSSEPQSPESTKSETLEDWDDYFEIFESQDFIIEIVGDRLKEILATSGRGDLFW